MCVRLCMNIICLLLLFVVFIVCVCVLVRLSVLCGLIIFVMFYELILLML